MKEIVTVNYQGAARTVPTKYAENGFLATDADGTVLAFTAEPVINKRGKYWQGRQGQLGAIVDLEMTPLISWDSSAIKISDLIEGAK